MSHIKFIHIKQYKYRIYSSKYFSGLKSGTQRTWNLLQVELWRHENNYRLTFVFFGKGISIIRIEIKDLLKI